MYVWARLARVVATANRRGPLPTPESESRLAFRCLPTDIDPNIHLNNARYMMLADLGRFDLLIRSGLLAVARRNDWAPIMGGVQAVYSRQIKLWQKFHVISSFETWTGTQFVGRHRFELDDGRTAAMVLTTAGIYDRTRRCFIPAEDLAAELGIKKMPRGPDSFEQYYLNSHNLIRSAIKDMNRPFSKNR
jgi:acyl-CoA thioesterase FadM